MAEVEASQENNPGGQPGSSLAPNPKEPAETRFLKWLVLGPNGLRSGWLATGFLAVDFVASGIFSLIGAKLLGIPLENAVNGFGPDTAGFLEVVSFLALLTAMGLGALAARRNLLDFNLRERNWPLHLATGVLGGLAALSLLLAVLYGGGWIHFGAAELHGPAAMRFGLAWAGVFLLTGLTEEGTTRCFLLSTLSRGVNVWWALGFMGTLCALAAVNSHGNGTAGIYAAAALGAPGCVVLSLRRSEAERFWCAAWLTSVLFGYLHTFNHGESAVGIFGTALIGFAFCVSVRALGSAWWAIGFHAAWDWGQTFVFGTADSGLSPKHHWFTSAPSGAELWSGGSAGPEGSLLIIPLIALIIAGLLGLSMMRRKRRSLSSTELRQIS